MTELPPQTAAGKVCLHFAMSLDGFVAGPGHSMDFLSGSTSRPGLIQERVDTTGAVLAGRDGFDSAIGDSRPYQARGPLAHHRTPAASPRSGGRDRPPSGPVLLGDGIRLHDVPGGHLLHLQRVGTEPTQCASLRYLPPRP